MHDDDELFPALTNWRDGKLKDLSNVLSTFFNYLSISREGFSPVEKNPTDSMSVHPVITRDMANYIVSEIFPCSDMIRESQFIVYKSPDYITKRIERQLKDGISNKSFLATLSSKNVPKPPDLTIDAGVFQTIWTYLSNGMGSLGMGAKSNEEVLQRIAASEDTVIGMRNCSMNYGFNYDAENCAFQAFLYVMITLSDWLEDSEIGQPEVITAYKIIYPHDLQVNIIPSDDKRVEDIILGAIVSKNLVPTTAGLKLLVTIMKDVGRRINDLQNKNSRRIMSRLMALCQPV